MASSKKGKKIKVKRLSLPSPSKESKKLDYESDSKTTTKDEKNEKIKKPPNNSNIVVETENIPKKKNKRKKKRDSSNSVSSSKEEEQHDETSEDEPVKDATKIVKEEPEDEEVAVESDDKENNSDVIADDETPEVTKKSVEGEDEDEENMVESDDNSDEDKNIETSVEKAKPRSKEETKEKKENDSTSLITTSTFASLGVHASLCESSLAAGWTTATRIQKETIPHALTKRDIIGLAETGSGKTGTFAIPILQSLLEEAQYRKSVYALVLAPTRELAFQIQEVFQALGSAIGVNSVCIVGGVDMTSQSIALARLPHIVIATPGRLLDHLQNTKGFSLSKIKFLILDEADRMLSLDFEEEINQILAVIPDSSQGRQTMLFSATMTSKVQKLQRASLYDPIRIEVSTKFQTPDTLIQSYLFIPAKYKDCYFTYLLANECKSKSMLVFVSTCNNAQRLALLLRNLGLSAICLHGQMNQSKRLGALHKFKSASRDILICTDIASRGLDIPHVDVVVNYDLPNHGKDYIHRVGRTARAGRSGQAFALVTQYDVEVYQRLEGLLGQKLPEYTLSEELVLILLERVSEAQRLANRELREQLSSFQGKNKRRRGGKMDEDGMESEIQKELQLGYKGGSGGAGGALPNQRGSGTNSKKYRHKN